MANTNLINSPALGDAHGRAVEEVTVTAADVTLALRQMTDHRPELRPLLEAARNIITRLETDKSEAVLRLALGKPQHAIDLLKCEATTTIKVVRD